MYNVQLYGEKSSYHVIMVTNTISIQGMSFTNDLFSPEFHEERIWRKETGFVGSNFRKVYNTVMERDTKIRHGNPGLKL